MTIWKKNNFLTLYSNSAAGCKFCYEKSDGWVGKIVISCCAVTIVKNMSTETGKMCARNLTLKITGFISYCLYYYLECRTKSVLHHYKLKQENLSNTEHLAILKSWPHLK
jgi:hypothetical protein